MSYGDSTLLANSGEEANSDELIKIIHWGRHLRVLGDAVSAMLPKGYTECDAVLQAKDVTADGEADAEGDHSIYARFTGQLAGTLPPLAWLARRWSSAAHHRR